LRSVFGFGLNKFLSQDSLESWGWRVPFICGMLIGPVGLYIRMKMDETPEFVEAEVIRSPVIRTFTHHFDRVLSAAAIVGFASISVYLIVYLPTFAVKNLALPSYAGYLGGIISGLVTLIGAPYVGKLADRVGCVRVMTVSPAAAVVLGWPLFKFLVGSPSVLSLTVVEVILGIILAFYFGPLPALLAEMFPTNIRSTGMSVILQPRRDLVRRIRTADSHMADRPHRLAAGPQLLLHRRRVRFPDRAHRGAHPAGSPVAGCPSAWSRLVMMWRPQRSGDASSKAPGRPLTAWLPPVRGRAGSIG